MHHKEIAINNQKIAYYESSGKGQPVLFIHGNSMSGRSFEKQLESSLGEQYRLVAMDLPGHGKSAPAQDPKTAYMVPGYADIVAAFAQGLDLENAVLAGWSLGGHILLEAVGRLQKARGLMIFGTPPIKNPLDASAYLPHPLTPLLFKNGLSTEEADALTAAFFKAGEHIPKFFYEDMRRADGMARETLGICLGTGTYADEARIVAELKIPIAILQSEMDPVVNLSYLENLSIPKLWKGGIQIIPDAGHTPQWEQAERFNDLLKEFIEDCTQGSFT